MCPKKVNLYRAGEIAAHQRLQAQVGDLPRNLIFTLSPIKSLVDFNTRGNNRGQSDPPSNQ